jgi:sulfide:quinone oxidoreductase
MAASVVVAGGGVAALEAVAALRALAPPDVELVVVSPQPWDELRALSVNAPFDLPTPTRLALDELAERIPFTLRLGALAEVDPGARAVRLEDGSTLAYDALLVATGAVARPPFPGAITFAGVGDAAAVADAVETARELAFVAPVASGWALPLYELALLAAHERRTGSVAVVTAEPTPLWIFGEEAGAAVHDLLAARGVALLSGARVLAAAEGALELDGLESISADAAVALPRLVGPAIPGLPADDDGFLPVDAHGAVVEVADVYAAGDVTAFPLKQGGLATEQADAAAESIAAAIGAPVTPTPFVPVLRGLLLTGDAPLYLRSDGITGTAQRLPRGAVSDDALWWPPAKVAGRYLAPLLAGAESRGAQLEDLVGPVDDGPGDATALVLALAQEDAARGDYERALGALDTAAALADGGLAPEWERARTMWLARAGREPR